MDEDSHCQVLCIYIYAQTVLKQCHKTGAQYSLIFTWAVLFLRSPHFVPEILASVILSCTVIEFFYLPSPYYLFLGVAILYSVCMV